MKTILVLGAGRSSSSLIKYLLTEGEKKGWRIVVGDFSQSIAAARIGRSARGEAIAFDIHQQMESAATIRQADIVISLLPANLHPLVAKHCLQEGKHLLTASYVSEEIRRLDDEARNLGLLFLNESGLDPGIDHMSAMQVIEKIKDQGGMVTSFESFTGGLIAPETDQGNPWNYKFTWNARNVVLAGQSTAKYLLEGEYKYIPYQQLFKRVTPVEVEGYGEYEGYANRDSLKYIDIYGLKGIRTMLRGTLRNKGFCSAWNVFVQLGCCDDSYQMENVAQMSHRAYLNAFLPADPTRSLEEKLANQLGISIQGDEMKKLNWSGFFDDTRIGLQQGTPARLLEHILNKKWKLDEDNKDLIVMWHRFIYRQANQNREVQASLVVKGNDAVETAMAKTVGLPLGIAAKLLLEGKISKRGVVLPVTKEFYEPILSELKMFGIELTEKSFDRK